MADNALEASKSYVKDDRSKNAITIMNSTFHSKNYQIF